MLRMLPTCPAFISSQYKSSLAQSQWTGTHCEGHIDLRSEKNIASQTLLLLMKIKNSPARQNLP